jgi:uncharacterized protein YndB with AHSA1/START domain
MKINDQPAQFTSPAEVRLVRLLPGPIERVWEFLTDPAKRARWLCGGVFEARAGGKIEFFMHHAELAPDETPPAKYKKIHDEGVTFPGTVLRCEPPRLLVHTFGGPDSEVTFELTPQGDRVQLVLTHRAKGEDLPELHDFATGWHVHTSVLVALLEDTPRPPFWPEHSRLKAFYEARKPKA